METAEDVQAGRAISSLANAGSFIQPAGYLLELSLDWIVLRSSQNIHHLLGHSHVTLVDEPLGKFVHNQALHDLRNLFSKLSGTTGIARAYGTRLTDDPDLVDIAFQLSDGRVILEAVPTKGVFGDSFGSVGGLISGLAAAHGQALLDNAARRMRALTGYDRVTLICGAERSESCRGAFSAPASARDDVPAIVSDINAEPVELFPHGAKESAAAAALMRSCDRDTRASLTEQGVRACLRIPFTGDGTGGEFRCDSRTERAPDFELHAAAELFAQLFAMRLEIDRLRHS